MSICFLNRWKGKIAMPNEKPFIHMIKTPLNKYFYDVNTNMFVQVNDDVYQYLNEVEHGEGDLYNIPDRQICHNISYLQEQGFLSMEHPKKIQHGSNELLEYHLNENINQIALQVTQQCNFRCAYCVYSAGDFVHQRSHSPKHMSIDTACAAVDFFTARCGNQNQPAIAFYGGEPLLEFPLIQDVVKYAEKRIYGKKLRFAITTNASLLTPNIAQFFIEHNFLTTISLDGASEAHDRSRRFANNGKGSFAAISNNLKKVLEECPNFKYSFNVVIDPRFACDSVHKLFSYEPPFCNVRFTTNYISDMYSIEKTVAGDKFKQQNDCYTFKGYLAFRGIYDQENVSRVAYTTLANRFGKLQRRMKPEAPLPDVTAPSGPCIPGARRLLVDVDGNFYPCERVSETSQAMNIGNLQEGFDYDKVIKLLNIAQTTAESCKNCWAFRHCNLCCSHSDNCGELSADLRSSQCSNTRLYVEDMFKDYLWMKEFDVVVNHT